MTRTPRRFAGLVGSRILAIADEVRALQAGGRQICNLSIGDFDPREFPIPRLLLERIEAALGRGETNYPPAVGIPALREQVSALYARELGAKTIAVLFPQPESEDARRHLQWIRTLSARVIEVPA